MISIPLPFVTATLLGVLLGVVITHKGPSNRSLLLFLGLCIALMVVVGARWSFEARGLRALQPVIAALLPAAAWLCFSPLLGARAGPLWPHLAPAAAVVALSSFGPAFHITDLLLAGLFLGYGAVFLRRGLAGRDSLAGARLGEVPRAGRATALVGGLLIFSGLIDLAIAADFGLGDGVNAARIVSAGNMVVLPLIAWATVLIAGSAPEPERGPEPPGAEAPAPAPPTDCDFPDDDHILAEIDRLLTERRLYRDPDLTLERLSRRLAIPARQVSGAINRKLGRNVSQAINEWRIREAMDLLSRTDRPVTAIMFDCGFQTKSNFNREFQRVTGTSPTEWRRRAGQGGVTRVAARSQGTG